MQRKLKRNLLILGTFSVMLLLFCARLTGVAIHIIAGLAFVIALSVHTWKRRGRMRKVPSAYRIADLVTLISMIGVLMSGFMLKPFREIIAVLLIHKLCSVFFAVGLLVHIIQHMPKCKKKRIAENPKIKLCLQETGLYFMGGRVV